MDAAEAANPQSQTVTTDCTDCTDEKYCFFIIREIRVIRGYKPLKN